MQLENFEIKKSRKKKTAETAPVLVASAISEKKPRKKKESLKFEGTTIIPEKQKRVRAFKNPMEKMMTPFAEREDAVREVSHTPENLPFEPSEAPADIDNLSFNDIIRKEYDIPSPDEVLEFENDQVALGKQLEKLVASGDATVETVSTSDPFEAAPVIEQPIVSKPIQRWPETTRVIAPKHKTAGFMGRIGRRLRDAFDRLIDSADDLDEE